MQINYHPLRKITGQLHLWLGMASGLVIIILGITGCIYAFIDEIRPVVYHERIFITPPPANSKMLPLQDLKAKAQKALNKQVPLMDIEVYTDRKHTMVFRYRNRNNNANLYTNYFLNYDKVYLNPYTGEIVKVENAKWEFFNIIVMIHCTLLLGNLGKQIIIWCTVIFLIMLVSGLILWWPRNRAASRKRFTFNWKKSTSWKRKNYDLHQIFGFYIFIIAFFVALSGLCMVLPQLDSAMVYIINPGAENEKATMMHTSHMGGTITAVEEKDSILNTIAAHALVMNPGAVKHRIFTPKTGKDPIVVKNYKDQGTHFAYLQDQYDPSTARHTSTTYFAELSAGEQVHEAMYDIHVGAILGLPGKILAFLVSLITATLPISGFLIWKGRRNKI